MANNDSSINTTQGNITTNDTNVIKSSKIKKKQILVKI